MVGRSSVTWIQIVGGIGRHGDERKVLEYGDRASPGPRVETKRAAWIDSSLS